MPSIVLFIHPRSRLFLSSDRVFPSLQRSLFTKNRQEKKYCFGTSVLVESPTTNRTERERGKNAKNRENSHLLVASFSARLAIGIPFETSLSSVNTHTDTQWSCGIVSQQQPSCSCSVKRFKLPTGSTMVKNRRILQPVSTMILINIWVHWHEMRNKKYTVHLSPVTNTSLVIQWLTGSRERHVSHLWCNFQEALEKVDNISVRPVNFPIIRKWKLMKNYHPTVVHQTHAHWVSKVSRSMDRHRSIDLSLLADDCDAAPMKTFTGEYSRMYQNGQDCQCDSDHDECLLNNIMVSVFYSITSDVFSSLVTLMIFSTLLHLTVHRKGFSNEPDEFDA